MSVSPVYLFIYLSMESWVFILSYRLYSITIIIYFIVQIIQIGHCELL